MRKTLAVLGLIMGFTLYFNFVVPHFERMEKKAADDLQADKDNSTVLVETKLTAVITTTQSSLSDAFKKCSGEVEVVGFRGKKYWRVCSITAEFYDPSEKIYKDDKKIILPVSVYKQFNESGLDLLNKGYMLRNASVNVSVWETEPMVGTPAMAEKSVPLVNTFKS